MKATSEPRTEAESPMEADDSPQYVRFKAAMKQILSVKKVDIEHKLPKMFQVRKATTKKKTARKRKTK